jgi:hypothetical protein
VKIQNSDTPSREFQACATFVRLMSHNEVEIMKDPQLLWLTDGAGQLSAKDAEYSVTVERLLPAADAHFKVWTLSREPCEMVASGIRPSVEAAMLAAEETAAAMRRHTHIAA